MSSAVQNFVALTLEVGALKWGSFTLKSGRQSPYFFNAGLFKTGGQMARLSHAYAQALVESGIAFDMLFGPAYKGIPLAAATAVTLAKDFNQDIPFAFNRKEAKDHGEGGSIVGASLAGKVMIVDDVITAGTAIRESIDLIKAHGAEPAGVLVALDRQERGQGELSAIQEVGRDYGIPVIAVATLADLIQYLRDQGNADQLAAMEDYRNTYGIR